MSHNAQGAMPETNPPPQNPCAGSSRCLGNQPPLHRLTVEAMQQSEQCINRLTDQCTLGLDGRFNTEKLLKTKKKVSYSHYIRSDETTSSFTQAFEHVNRMNIASARAQQLCHANFPSTQSHGEQCGQMMWRMPTIDDMCDLMASDSPYLAWLASQSYGQLFWTSTPSEDNSSGMWCVDLRKQDFEVISVYNNAISTVVTDIY